MSRLITTSLIDSVAWAKSAPTRKQEDGGPSWAEKAYADLKKTLSRAEWTPDSWLKRGIDFEQLVYKQTAAHVDPETSTGSEFFKAFLREAQGAQLYKKSKTFIQLEGEEYCVYGKLDLFWPAKEVFPGKIKDIKTTKSYGGKDKYLKTCQHKIYCMNEGIPDFEYLIAEFSDNCEDMEIKGMYHVPYHVDSFKDIKDEVTERIQATVDFLKGFEGEGDLWDLYLNKFCYKW